MRWMLAVTLLVPLPAYAQWQCEDRPAISDESGPAVCSPGFAVSGVKCEGDFCDNVTVTCCRYMPDTYVPQGGADPVPAPGLAARAEESDWTAWFSEEGSGTASRTSDQNRLISGLQCRGDYCDDIRMLPFSPIARPGDRCSWLDPVSDEDSSGAQCAQGWYVSDMKCSGRYCDSLQLKCCTARNEPDFDLVFTGGHSCIRLPRTGRGFSVAAEAAPPGIPADLSAPNSRPDWICPSGYAMRGLECSGDYCSYLNTICCSYAAADNSKPRYRLSPEFSEEGRRNGAASDTEFVTGVRCGGNYCDDVEAVFMSSTELQNDSNACHTVGPFSEEQGSAQCETYEFVAGIQCHGEYCDSLSLKCCRYSTSLPR